MPNAISVSLPPSSGGRPQREHTFFIRRFIGRRPESPATDAANLPALLIFFCFRTTIYTEVSMRIGYIRVYMT